MLIHLESGNCITSPEEMDHYAQKCYQSAKYVTPGCEHYLRARMRPEQRAHGAFNPERGNYRCEECSKAFWSNAGMMRHIQSPVHDHQAYRCPGCGVTATALSGLLQHVESESCHETIHHGSGSLGKMLHFLHVVLDKKR